MLAIGETNEGKDECDPPTCCMLSAIDREYACREVRP